MSGILKLGAKFLERSLKAPHPGSFISGRRETRAVSGGEGRPVVLRIRIGHFNDSIVRRPIFGNLHCPQNYFGTEKFDGPRQTRCDAHFYFREI
jgi:hypothetical protein